MQESKEKINSRMIKNASRLWGFQDTQSESSFDPVVGLIFGALASELAKISTDINTVEARILEKLVDLLTPEPVTGPFPAHFLLRAKPTDPVLTLTSNYQFYLNKRFVVPGEHKADEKTVFFTPAGDFKLFSGQLKYLVTPQKLYKFHEEFEKEVVAVGRSSRSVNASQLWFGLEIHEDVNSLDGMTICFDLRNDLYSDSFYEVLAKGKWSINNKTVNFKQGIDHKTGEAETHDSLLQNELDITSKVFNHVNRYYFKRFLTLEKSDTSLVENSTEKNVSDELYEIFAEDDIQDMENKLTWIKVEFPQIIPAEVFDDLFCSINCFPAINRHLNEFTQSSREFINIIPLITDEVYLDMKRVTNSTGNRFIQKSFSGINDVEEGSYIIRHGGVGRFDSRNAAEFVSYLLELLRDESAAFSLIGADMISSDLKELNQTITRLEHRLNESNVVKRDTPYLLLKSHPDHDTLFVEFWTTNGKFANKIKAGEKLFLYEGSGLWPDSLISLTSSVGGREKMVTEERVNAYRKALLSHGRVVTKEDIKALCHEHFGKILKKVEIKKGVQIGKSTDSGFIQSLDIFLTFHKSSEELDKDDIHFLKKDLLIKLEEQSANIMPYRCFINPE